MRKATIPGRHGRPTVILDGNNCFWFGNESQEKLTISAMEVCGFNTGNFDYKIISGRLDQNSVPWRLSSDLDLIVVVNEDKSKSVMSVCQYLHLLASSKGLADVTLRDHDLKPKLLPPVPRAICCIFSTCHPKVGRFGCGYF